MEKVKRWEPVGLGTPVVFQEGGIVFLQVPPLLRDTAPCLSSIRLNLIHSQFLFLIFPFLKVICIILNYVYGGISADALGS